MDEQKGETKEEEVTDEGLGELEIEELVPEWGLTKRWREFISETRWSIAKWAISYF